MSDQPDEHDRDVELTHEDTVADEDEEHEELTEAQQEARRRQDEERRRQDIEHDSVDRETDALEQENPNYHRDERPENS